MATRTPDRHGGGWERFTLTLYEISEQVEMRYVGGGKYVRADSFVPRRGYGSNESLTTMEDLPSGRLALRACAADWRGKWEMHWRESKGGELPSKFRTIRRDLKAAIPGITERIQEADRQAEIQRQQWEAEERERKSREQKERRAKTINQSRQQLLAIVEEWSLACRIEAFFEDLKARSDCVDQDLRDATLARFERARQLLGGINALDHFESWRSPEEREPNLMNERQGE